MKNIYKNLNARWLALQWDEQLSVLALITTIVLVAEIVTQ